MIAIEWGSSAVNAFRVDADGTVLEQRKAATGLLACGGRFGAVLADLVQGWSDTTIAMAGAIGGRSGWLEVPYVVCPAGLGEVAAGGCPLVSSSLPGRQIWIAPGVMCRGPRATPDVMRGEETQVLGLASELDPDQSHWICLPGAHTKWVRVEGGCITSLRTAMTGEVYALLRRHSLLASLMPTSPNSDVDDSEAFARGVTASAGAEGMLNQLFAVRTLGLFEALEPAFAASYLSGLLIGHELRGLLPEGVDHVHLIGEPGAVRRYGVALGLLERTSRVHGESLTARGLLRLAAARGGPA